MPWLYSWLYVEALYHGFILGFILGFMSLGRGVSVASVASGLRILFVRQALALTPESVPVGSADEFPDPGSRARRWGTLKNEGNAVPAASGELDPLVRARLAS